MPKLLVLKISKYGVLETVGYPTQLEGAEYPAGNEVGTNFAINWLA